MARKLGQRCPSGITLCTETAAFLIRKARPVSPSDSARERPRTCRRVRGPGSRSAGVPFQKCASNTLRVELPGASHAGVQGVSHRGRGSSTMRGWHADRSGTGAPHACGSVRCDCSGTQPLRGCMRPSCSRSRLHAVATAQASVIPFVQAADHRTGQGPFAGSRAPRSRLQR